MILNLRCRAPLRPLPSSTALRKRSKSSFENLRRSKVTPPGVTMSQAGYLAERNPSRGTCASGTLSSRAESFTSIHPNRTCTSGQLDRSGSLEVAGVALAEFCVLSSSCGSQSRPVRPDRLGGWQITVYSFVVANVVASVRPAHHRSLRLFLYRCA